MTLNFDNYDFFHVIDLPDGRTTPGITDHRGQPKFLGLDKENALKGLRVLDVGSNDGFWSFWAEENGAKHVLAIDVDEYSKYDWGHGGPPQDVDAYPQGNKKDVFSNLKKLFGSAVERQNINVYEVNESDHGMFDAIIFYGVLYHLRHPLLAFDVLRKVCRGFVLVETHVANRNPFLPASVFYEDDVLSGYTNWTGPSEASVVHWMKNAGFGTIYRQKTSYENYNTRQSFIGVIDDHWNDIFAKNENFRLCDEGYFSRCKAEIRGHLGMI